MLKETKNFTWLTKNSLDSLYCDVHFIVVVWSGTRNISRVCLYLGDFSYLGVHHQIESQSVSASILFTSVSLGIGWAHANQWLPN